MNAVAVVLQCSASVGSDTPSPSHVRAARHLVHQLASNESFEYKCAKAMARYDGPKQAMESAGLAAELGLNDAAADATFEQLLQKMENIRVGFREHRGLGILPMVGRHTTLAPIVSCCSLPKPASSRCTWWSLHGLSRAWSSSWSRCWHASPICHCCWVVEVISQGTTSSSSFSAWRMQTRAATAQAKQRESAKPQ